MNASFLKENKYSLGALVIAVVLLVILIISGAVLSGSDTVLGKKKRNASEIVVASSSLSYDCTVADAPIVYYFSYEEKGKKKLAITEPLGTGCPDAALLKKSKSIEAEEITISEKDNTVIRENGDTYTLQAILNS